MELSDGLRAKAGRPNMAAKLIHPKTLTVCLPGRGEPIQRPSIQLFKEFQPLVEA